MRVEPMSIFGSAHCSNNELWSHLGAGLFCIPWELKVQRSVSVERYQWSVVGVQVHISHYCKCTSSPIHEFQNSGAWQEADIKISDMNSLEIPSEGMLFLLIELTSSHNHSKFTFSHHPKPKNSWTLAIISLALQSVNTSFSSKLFKIMLKFQGVYLNIQYNYTVSA